MESVELYGGPQERLIPTYFQTSKVILSLFESDTQVKIIKSKLELATGPGISEFFGLPWLLKIKKIFAYLPIVISILLSLASAAERPGL